MEKKMIRLTLLATLTLVFLSMLAIRIWAHPSEPYSMPCPLGDGTGYRDYNEPCSVGDNNSMTCIYVHTTMTNEQHRFRARVQ
jgi:hypothetical protein